MSRGLGWVFLGWMDLRFRFCWVEGSVVVVGFI